MARFKTRPRLVDTRTGQEHLLSKESTTVGRHKSADIVIPVVEVSRRHCRIYEEGELFYVEDLRTVNGTYVNEEPVMQSTILQHGFHLKVAKCSKYPGGVRNFVFRHPEQAQRVKEAAARTADDILAELEGTTQSDKGKKGRQVPIQHVVFRMTRRRERPRQIPVLKFSPEEVRFLNLFPLGPGEPLSLSIEHGSWPEKIEFTVKVVQITPIKTRPVFQVQAEVTGFGSAQQEACQRLIDASEGLLKYFS